jgi:hypothetical protein
MCCSLGVITHGVLPAAAAAALVQYMCAVGKAIVWTAQHQCLYSFRVLHSGSMIELFWYAQGFLVSWVLWFSVRISGEPHVRAQHADIF